MSRNSLLDPQPDPDFLYRMAEFAKSQNDEAGAEQYEQRALKIDLGLGLVRLFEWLLSRPCSRARVVVPHPGSNRRDRRAAAVKGKQFGKLTPKQLAEFFARNKKELTRV